ncbi:hypothetical protein IX51_08610 [uncultured archaeon]|nr:hypothetical protein IX51_08610 [uncultured archaeon]
MAVPRDDFLKVSQKKGPVTTGYQADTIQKSLFVQFGDPASLDPAASDVFIILPVIAVGTVGKPGLCLFSSD